MKVPNVHVFNISPLKSTWIADVPGEPGDQFRASIYKMDDGMIGVFIEVDESVNQSESASRMNSRIAETAQSAQSVTKKKGVDFYVWCEKSFAKEG